MRGEEIWDYHLILSRLSQRAYDNELMRQGSMRESFIANIGDSYIASRLREEEQLDTEQLLDLAIKLQGCQQASAKQVNFLDSSADPLNRKISHLADVVEKLAVHTLTPKDTTQHPKQTPRATPVQTHVFQQPTPSYVYNDHISADHQQAYEYEQYPPPTPYENPTYRHYQQPY